MKFEEIIKDLKNKKYAPIYTLQGEEPYFIDQISDFIEDNVLSEGEKSFNQTILYGKDTDYLTLMDILRRYPMMSQYQVVILKEAQQMKELEKLIKYLEQPLQSTIFVICHKYKTIKRNTNFGKKLAEKSVFYTSEPLRDYQVPPWIGTYLSTKGYKIDEKASRLLEEYLGNDLSKIANSLDKLVLNIDKSKTILTDDIEKYIGISKEYNVFELNNALMQKDILKANKIINYFNANPKAGPMVLLLGTLYTLFSKIYMMHFMGGAGDKDLASQLKVNPYFVKDYKTAVRNYSLSKTESVIHLLQQYDLKSKGVNNNTDQGQLMKELIFKILH